MDIPHYTKLNRTISMGRANLISLALLFPVFLLPTVLFIWRWGSRRLMVGLETLYQRPLILILGFALLIALHELIHGLTWKWLSGSKREDVKYGFKWKTLTPYAHLKKPIDICPYRWGAAKPGILTGLLPALIGLVMSYGMRIEVWRALLALWSGVIYTQTELAELSDRENPARLK